MQRFTGPQYLQIDIANNFGLDKLSWAERLAWFEKHQDHLWEMLPQAAEPALFFAGVRAWEDVQQGLPIGYPVSLDATSSGLQILACLTGDRSAARLCNVIDTGARSDAYTGVYRAMLERLGEDAKIQREDTKRAIMTSLYGSQAVPKEVFGEGRLLQVFLATMQELAPAAWELNETFLDLWDPEALSHDWVLPDNFHVHIKVMAPATETVHVFNEPVEVRYRVNAPVKDGRSLGANTIHSVDALIVRELTRRCYYDPAKVEAAKLHLYETWEAPATPACRENLDLVRTLWGHYEESGYLSARILDHLDAHSVHLITDRDAVLELIDSLPAKPFAVVSVHDCFRCLPHYANDLREQYNRQLMLIARSDLLQFLIGQIIGRPVRLGKLDPNLWIEILDTDYALS